MRIRLLLAAVTISLGACSQNNTIDFCKTHKIEHQNHVSEITRLTAILKKDSTFSMGINFNEKNYNDFAKLDVEKVVVFNTNDNCVLLNSSITDNSLTIGYQCNPNTSQLKNIEINLLDELSLIEEIDTTFTTPSVTKKFIIHRKCEKPIYYN